MSRATLAHTLEFVDRIVTETNQRKVTVTFHGGEPLVSGMEFWREALSGLDRRFGPRALDLSIQSNLWFLDDEKCALFRRHRVHIGTSFDGPEAITDAQRGRGYFARTMAGIRRAQAHGLGIGCIATVTPIALPRWREVFDFFLAGRLGFSIHPAVPALENPDRTHVLSPEQYRRLLEEMLDYYVVHRRELAVASLDQMCRAVANGEGTVCTFRDCLGMFLAVDPAGDIYACQRFCGRPEWRLGTLAQRPSLEQLLSSPVARRFRERQEKVRQTCGGCPHVSHCLGGCPYNAWANGTSGAVRDAYCEAYRAVFDRIRTRLLEEALSGDNLQAVAERPYTGTGHPLYRRGPLIDLAREGPHPSHTARVARRIVAAVELARGPDLPAVAHRLAAAGICATGQSATASLEALRQRLYPESRSLNNLYLHVTFGCQLECSHCYARAGPATASGVEMPLDAIESLVGEAQAAGFQKVVITGGEPLYHSRRNDILDRLAALRGSAAPMSLVLRTNLALPLPDNDLLRVANAFDRVVVSVDGDRETHDGRRGSGAYDKVVHNLARYRSLVAGRTHPARSPAPGELCLAAVLGAAAMQGGPEHAVRELARRMGIRRTRFRPLLPLGRARDWPEPPASEALGGYSDARDIIESGFQPASGCGLGQNLYVGPSGESFPCYAYRPSSAFLGNVVSGGLRAALESAAFRDLITHTVDTNRQCRECEVRYLCGGACRAWGGESAQQDLDAPPAECSGLRARALAILEAARAFLELDRDKAEPGSGRTGFRGAEIHPQEDIHV
jgi:uncharacterized protein